MLKTLQDFSGSYTIRYGAETPLFTVRIQPDYQLLIGTGTHEAALSDGIRIGVSILDDAGQRVLPKAGDPPAYAYLVDGTLNGETTWLDPTSGLPTLVTYQISLLALRLRNGNPFNIATITITLGDPENAGVWGADDDAGGG